MTTTKDEAIKTLREALKWMLDEKCDYMRRNNLGNPDIEGTNIAAVAALAATSHIAPDAALPVVSDEMREVMKFACSPAIAPEASELPPKPKKKIVRYHNAAEELIGYNDEQMDDYARAAIAMHQTKEKS